MSHLFTEPRDVFGPAPAETRREVQLGNATVDRLAECIILLALLLAFLDESVRKIMPGQPVAATAPKDVLLWLAGGLALAIDPYARRAAWRFAPWVIYVLVSSIVVFTESHEAVHFAAVLRSYLGSVMIIASGVYVGSQSALLRKVKVLFCAGALFAAIIAIGQEFRRDSLSEVFATRIYVEQHSRAGGLYNEGPFVSPQTLGQCMLVAVVATFVTAGSRFRSIAGSSAALLIFAIALYLSRIRAAALMTAIAGSHLLLLLSRYSIDRTRRIRNRMMGLAVPAMAVLCIAVAVVGTDWMEAGATDFERDADFYASAADGDEIFLRTFFFVYELSGLPSDCWSVGYGAGTGGSLRTLLPYYDDRVPPVLDTGMFLLVVEFGAAGLVLFVLAVSRLFVWIASNCRQSAQIPPDVFWCIPVATVFTIWFLLKSHTCISNGFAQMMWFGSLGIAVGLLRVQPSAAENRSL